MANDTTTHMFPPLPRDRAFVIQFNSETAPARNHFAGRVEHVSSGQAVHFQSLMELLLFVERTIKAINNEADGNK
jgi:hypothetical protein